jgi:glycosyltransferase involved in cell wall biosynthesis
LSENALSQIEGFTRLLPISVVTNEGKGLVDALNTGLRVAKGKYIARIDNDDLMSPNRIEKQIAQLQSDHDLVAVGSQCLYINSVGERTGRSNYPEGPLNNNPEFKHKCLIAHPSTMYLRASALAIGGYRSIFSWDGVDIAEDFDFWLRLSNQGIISVSNEILTEYRQHPTQLSSQHLTGQMIGTPYISAVNLGNDLNPIRISFEKNYSSELSVMLQQIKRNLGFKEYLACRLIIIQFMGNKPKANLVVVRLISKLVRLLSL